MHAFSFFPDCFSLALPTFLFHIYDLNWTFSLIWVCPAVKFYFLTESIVEAPIKKNEEHRSIVAFTASRHDLEDAQKFTSDFILIEKIFRK